MGLIAGAIYTDNEVQEKFSHQDHDYVIENTLLDQDISSFNVKGEVGYYDDNGTWVEIVSHDETDTHPTTAQSYVIFANAGIPTFNQTDQAGHFGFLLCGSEIKGLLSTILGTNAASLLSDQAGYDIVLQLQIRTETAGNVTFRKDLDDIPIKFLPSNH